MKEDRYIILLVFILLAAGVVTSVSAFHVEGYRERISVNPDSLTTQEDVTLSTVIRFEYLNGSTFPKDHTVRCRSDLEKVRWTYEVIVDGDIRLRETAKDPSFIIPGFSLSYSEYAGQSMKINITVEGKVPEKPVGTEITLLKVWQVDPTGSPLPESHYTHLKEGTITKKYVPPTPEPTFTPTPAPTILSISSVPEGALVIVDDRVEGTTPYTLRDIAAGEHIVAVNLTGYHTWSSSIDVEGSKTTRISAILQPVPKEEGIPVIGGIIEGVSGFFGGIAEFITGFFSGGGEHTEGDMDERLAKLAELEAEDD
ncbi:PEGA domain-containing protein [Methanoculleus palmolei]|jgi:hypothetical protein|uniref:PEGA domain-containing protein n=1 Tax=Methanoculleus palmolei TaxID=72612 RepID=A0ABD8AAQ0_9EURY|nr:PEGA domain-containing protein [Methanoculleus palmolei]